MSASAATEAQRTDSPTSAPVRALLWLQPDTEEVLDRIRGQTSDLRVDLLVDALEPMPGDLGAQLRIAQALSRQREVSLVIWFVRPVNGGRHFIVNIAIPETRRLLTRDLGLDEPDSRSGGLSSAVKESAALVVRAAIQAVLGGSAIGERDSAQLDEVTEPRVSQNAVSDTPPGAPKDRRQRGASSGPAPAVVKPAEQPASSTNRDWPWAVGAEWLVLYDGAKNKQFAECALLRAERRTQWLNAFTVASGCLNREIDGASYGRFRVARQAATIGANAILLQRGIEASLGARVGAVFYERTTLPAPGAASPKTHVMGAVAPEFRLLVPARGSRVQAGFVFGVDFVTSSLRIDFVDPAAPGPNHFAPVTKISAIQPYATFGLAFRL